MFASQFRRFHFCGVAIAVLLLLTACRQRPSDDAGLAARVAGTPQPGAACAPAVRDELLRQQALVYWQVYCPSWLPDGFRLAALEDPTDASHLGGDVAPTRDDLNPGGGTFVTRLVGPGGAELVLVQGAGASIYTLRDAAGQLIGNDAQADAAFGALWGRLYSGEPPRVTASDALGYGHMLVGFGVAAAGVAQLAEAMRPVDPSGLRAALFSLADLHAIAPNWVVSWPPSSTGEDVRQPSVCGEGPSAADRLSDVVARFEPAPSGPEADAGGHGPFLQQDVAAFSPGGAQRYLDGVMAMLQGCASRYELKAADGTHEADVAVARLPFADLGDQSVFYRRSLRSPVQGSDVDVALIRRGDVVSTVLGFTLTTPEGTTDQLALLRYAQLADEKLRARDATPVAAIPTATAAAAPTALPAAAQDAVMEQTVRDCVTPGLPDDAPGAARVLDACLNGGEGGFIVAAAAGPVPVLLAERFEPATCRSHGFILWRADAAWRLQFATPLLPDRIDDRLLGAASDAGGPRVPAAGLARVSSGNDGVLLAVLALTASCGSGPSSQPLLFRLDGDVWRLVWDPRGSGLTTLSDSRAEFADADGIERVHVRGALWGSGDAAGQLFFESHPGPHRYVDQIWTRAGQRYVLSASTIEPSAYNTLVNFVYRISSGDDADAAMLLADQALLDTAKQLGLAQQPIGRQWMTNLDAKTECCGPIHILSGPEWHGGPPQPVVVTFVQRGDDWLISRIEVENGGTP